MSGWPEPVAFAAVWDRAVAGRADATFLVFETPAGSVARWSYGDFDQVVDRVAGTLAGLGAEPGSAVHLALTNSPTFIAVWLAASRLGAWIVPSDPMGRTPELAGHIERTRPAVGLCAGARAGIYRAAVAEAGRSDLAVIEIDEADTALAPFDASPLAPADRPEPGLHDRAAVMFTSGTTGRPKGVEVTQANYAFAGKVMAEAAGLAPDDRQLVVLPLFHANAQYYSFASAIWTGASVALMPSFSASGFLPAAARHSATCASLFAAPIRMILARGGPAEGARLRHCWYAQNIAADQYETVSEWFGCRPRQLYGMTETIPAVLTDEAADPHHASMGRVSPGCRVDVQDADGISVEPGVVGEVVVGGESGTTLFAGYLDAPDITAASFRDGWFLTGDRAVRDDHGPLLLRRPPLRCAEGLRRERLDRRGRVHLGRAPRGAGGRGGGSPRRHPRRGSGGLRGRRRPVGPACGRRARRLVRAAPGQGQAPGQHHPDRRTAPHQRRQDPQIPPSRASRQAVIGRSASGEEFGFADVVAGLVDEALGALGRLAESEVEAVAVQRVLDDVVPIGEPADASWLPMARRFSSRVVKGDFSGSSPVRATMRPSAARLVAHQAFSAASRMSPASRRASAASCRARASANSAAARSAAGSLLGGLPLDISLMLVVVISCLPMSFVLLAAR